MALMQWEPLSELGTIQTEMNRLFNTFFEGPPGNGGGRRWLPAMDLVETEDDFVLRADLPGMSEDDVTIQLRSRCPVSASPSTTATARATTAWSVAGGSSRGR